jgi:signal transduction histidine kinase
METIQERPYIAGVSRPGRLGLSVALLFFMAVFVRTISNDFPRPLLDLYVSLELLFLVLYGLPFAFPRLPAWLLHLVFASQSLLVLVILSLDPEFDFVTVLFMLLSYQAAFAFRGQARLAWLLILIVLNGGSLIAFHGLLRGLSLSLTTIAAQVVLPAYVRTNQEIEAARLKSQALLKDLQEMHAQLERYAGQVEELASIQERNRLARELHDTVSQLIFSINLTARSAQLLLVKDPGRAAEQMDLLRSMTGEALAQLRSLITQLRPPQAGLKA